MRFALVSACLVLSALSSAQSSSVETETLKKSAEAKTREIGQLAGSGKLPASDEAIQLLQKLVTELSEIRERLKTLESRQATTASDAALARRIRWGGYLQFQYQDSDRKGVTTFDAFRFRRARIGIDTDIAPRLAARVSFDLATGTNQTQEQLRDAIITYDASGGGHLGRDRAILGQMAIPLGYELERSSADREMPERAQYNQIFFATERSRGIRFRHEGRTGSLQVGVYNALTINDPEQTNLAPGPGDRLAVFGAARLLHRNGSVGISGYAGNRAAYTAGGATSPSEDRRFAYVDFEQRHVGLPRLSVRGEAMEGRDRVPSATASATNVAHDLAGFHLVGTYQLGKIDRLAVRWEGLDTNVAKSGSSIHGLGIAYLRDLTAAMRLTLGHEVFVDESRSSLGQKRYGLTTLRLQVRL